MAATRERLEAVIRRELSTAIRGALTHPGPSTGFMNRATEAILREVDEYTFAELGLVTPAERRHILFEGTS
jgi:hypothetical protein